MYHDIYIYIYGITAPDLKGKWVMSLFLPQLWLILDGGALSTGGEALLYVPGVPNLATLRCRVEPRTSQSGVLSSGSGWVEVHVQRAP